LKFFYVIISILIIYLFIRFTLISLIKKINQIVYLLRNGCHTTGTIIDVTSTKDIDGLIFYTSIIEFQGKDGTLHKSKSKFPTTTKGKVGKKVRLYYDEKNPEEIFTSSLSNGIVLFISFLFCIISIGLLMYYVAETLITSL
jgi:Protein of unknown function (DUF3592)